MEYFSTIERMEFCHLQQPGWTCAGSSPLRPFPVPNVCAWVPLSQSFVCEQFNLEV